MDDNVVARMSGVARECFRRPRVTSLLASSESRYVCPEEAEEFARAENLQGERRAAHRIDPKFKMVFLATVGGTLLFTCICVALRLGAGSSLSSADDELFGVMLTMVKIGFGAIVGLLGGESA